MSKQKMLEQYAATYCQRMGIENPPRFITSKSEYEQFIKGELGRNKMPRMKHNLGRCFKKRNTIWVNIRKHHGAITLRHTIAHELVHLKHPNLSHGVRFNKLTMDVITGKYVPTPQPIEPILNDEVAVNPTCSYCSTDCREQRETDQRISHAESYQEMWS